MDDSTDELEPLFDYHRVQPVNFIALEDDSDSSPAYIPKRRKFDKIDNKKVDDFDEDGKMVNKQVVCVDVDDDEEDWLRPPPKNVAPVAKRQEDSAIKELRIKKQELATLVQSAKNALQAVDDAAKRAATISSDSSIEQTTTESTEESLKPSTNRAKIVISIQDKAGTKQYRVFADDKFEQLFKKYASKAKIELEKLTFSFDGDKIDGASTPQSLGMEDDDLIEVNVKPN
ncbi:hypothetical protein RND81_02G205200 [Saponaria officinalis]|uniref:Rad60/SUMO-like domain-containing protein n=1 Tax=Saponaria officinalis TaxID=3572 RepID=A0AAW1MV13_SAPOF